MLFKVKYEAIRLICTDFTWLNRFSAILLESLHLFLHLLSTLFTHSHFSELSLPHMWLVISKNLSQGEQKYSFYDVKRLPSYAVECVNGSLCPSLFIIMSNQFNEQRNVQWIDSLCCVLYSVFLPSLLTYFIGSFSLMPDPQYLPTYLFTCLHLCQFLLRWKPCSHHCNLYEKIQNSDSVVVFLHGL